MYRFIFLALLFPVFVSAHLPILPEFQSYDDTYAIEHPDVSQAFYAELQDFPHTYEITIAETEEVFVEVLVPDIKVAENNKSAIIVKKLQRGGVEEVSRLPATQGTWESFYEPFGGDSYRRGLSFTGQLEPGSYLVEVSTPDNEGKYVLVVGELEDFSDMSYFETLKRIYAVKIFFNKSPIAVLQSPFYYIPIIFILLLLIGYRVYRKKHA